MSNRPARTREAMSALGRMPMVFRLAGALLLFAAIGGQIWQRRAGGTMTREMLAAVTRHCPSAAFHGHRPTNADGARALDRAALRLLLDRVFPLLAPRCGG